jgi:hypothetical protein
MTVPDDDAMYEYMDLSSPVCVFWDGVSSLISEIFPLWSMKSATYNEKFNQDK